MKEPRSEEREEREERGREIYDRRLSEISTRRTTTSRALSGRFCLVGHELTPATHQLKQVAGIIR